MSCFVVYDLATTFLSYTSQDFIHFCLGLVGPHTTNSDYRTVSNYVESIRFYIDETLKISIHFERAFTMHTDTKSLFSDEIFEFFPQFLTIFAQAHCRKKTFRFHTNSVFRIVEDRKFFFLTVTNS